MVPSKHNITFYRDYAFVLYIEIGRYMCIIGFNRTDSPASCSGNGGSAYRIHHIAAYRNDRSQLHHTHIHYLMMACPCSQCK